MAFDRNRKFAELRPVEAVVCEGSGLQANLYQTLRKAGIPIHAFRKADQAPDTPRPERLRVPVRDVGKVSYGDAMYIAA